jgi:hypothetical protein
MRRYLRAGLGTLSLLVTVAGGSLAMGAISASPAGATTTTLHMGTTSAGEVTPVTGTTPTLHKGHHATDFPDPDVVYSGSGSTYYAYGTGTSFPVTADWTTGGIGFTRLSCTTSGCNDQSDRTVAKTKTAVPRSLDVTYGLQAPSVVSLNNQWVMYYGGYYATANTGAYAVYYSTAPSGSPTSNFTNSLTEAPLIAQTGTGGSTDPSVLIRPTGQPWLTWKSSTYRKDNDKAHLWSMRLTTDGTAMKPGASSYVLATQPTGGWANTTIENPQMVWSGGVYYLFYSGGLWTTDTYAEGYTICAGPTGGCGTPNTYRILSKYTAGLYGPGGGSLFTTNTGTWLMAFHSWNSGCTRYATSCNGYRDLYVRPVDGLDPTSVPNIGTFTASQHTLPATGGSRTVTLTASNVARATSYTFISTPGPTGIPAFVNTTSGTARATVGIPANTSTAKEHYTFVVYATGPYGGQVSKALGVTVAPQPPVITSFYPTTNTLTEGGGDLHFNVGATGATSYQISASPSIPGIPANSPTVDVPPNASGTTIHYTFTVAVTNSGGTSYRTTTATEGSGQVVYASSAHGNTVVVRNLHPTTGSWSETDLGDDAVAAGSTPKVIDAQGTEEIWFNDATAGDTLAVWWLTPTTRTWSLIHPPSDALAAGSSPAPILAQGTEEVWFNDATSGDRMAYISLKSTGWTTPDRLGGDQLAAGTSPAPIIAQGTLEVWFNDATAGNQVAVWRWTWTQPTKTWSLVHLGGDRMDPASSPAPILAQGTEEVWINDATLGDYAAVWFAYPTHWGLVEIGFNKLVAGSSPAPIVAQGVTEEVWINDATGGGEIGELRCTPSGWSIHNFGGDLLSPGTTPAPVLAQNSEEVWYNDATAGHQLAVLRGTALTTWSPVRLGGSALTSASSPNALG